MHGQLCAVEAVAGGLAIDQYRQCFQVFPIEHQGLRRLCLIAAQAEAGGDVRRFGSDIDGKIDGIDPPGGWGVILEMDGVRGVGLHCVFGLHLETVDVTALVLTVFSRRV